MRELTPRKIKILRFIRDYNVKHRYCPGVREVRDFMGVGSTNTAHFAIKSMIEKGYVGAKYVGSVMSPNTIHATDKGLDLLEEIDIERRA